MRSERAIPLFEYIVRKTRPERPAPLRLSPGDRVAWRLKAEETVDLLKDALYSGEWWAPFRTAEVRRTVATALREIGSTGQSRCSGRGTRAPRRACRRTGGAQA